MARWLAVSAVVLASCNFVHADDKTDFFETHVRPLLVKNCYPCHTSAQSGGLQADSREHLLKGGNDGPAIVPGDPDKSLLIQAVRQTGRFKMPPGGKLSGTDIEALANWVRDGAVWPDSTEPTNGTLLSKGICSG